MVSELNVLVAHSGDHFEMSAMMLRVCKKAERNGVREMREKSHYIPN